MEIGEPQRTYTVEPLEDPVPREVTVPDDPAQQLPEEPAEPEKIPA
jgi:hypothetical protein